MSAMARLELLLFFLWVGVTVSTEVDLHKRIVGGHDCKDDESQHHVRLIPKKDNKESVCGGSLISDQWILTAAHCLEDGETIEAKFNVHAGVDKPVKIEATPLIYGPKGKKHDIMLLKLPISINKIKPIPLPDCKTDMPKIGEEFQIAGHGLDTVDSANKFLPHIPDKLQCVSMNFDDCKATIAVLKTAYPNIPPENWMCGKAPKKDIGHGDSGGGVVYKDKLHGVIIGGHPKDAFKEPFEFLPVCKYIVWIQDAIKP